MNKPPIDTPVNPASINQEPNFLIKECSLKGTPTDLFGPMSMQTLRVDDIERLFGIPCNTVRAWIKAAPNCLDPIPTMHIGRAVLIPAQAFRLWLLRQSRAQQIGA